MLAVDSELLQSIPAAVRHKIQGSICFCCCFPSRNAAFPIRLPEQRRRINAKVPQLCNGLRFFLPFSSLHCIHGYSTITVSPILTLPTHVSRETAKKKTLAKKQEAHFAFGNRFSSPHHTPLGMFYAVALTFHALITPQRTPARTIPQVFALQMAEIQPQNREIFQSSQSLRKNALLLRPIRWTDLTRV